MCSMYIHIKDRCLHDEDQIFIAPSIDISMFNVKFFTMYQVKMLAGAISKLLYGFASVRGDIFPYRHKTIQ